MGKKLILASASPRRKDLLEKYGYSFSVLNSGFSEVEYKKSPLKTAENNAFGKAKSVFDSLPEKADVVVLGADTVVAVGEKILGKPKDAEEARNTLSFLSGKTHEVYTGFCLICESGVVIGSDVSGVTFHRLTKKLIDDYVKSGKPLDKAGSYGIQDGYPIVKEYEGSLNNIVGLPMEKIKPLLSRFGIYPNKK